jgi:nucleotide-binding universal stress UspA family protein
VSFTTMKTVLVLTDFSINADYVAQYALRLSQNIGANLLLCNIYQMPAGEETTDRLTWPMRPCEENSINDLGAQVAQLKSRLDREVIADGFRPEIDQYSGEGLLSDAITELAASHNILMAVISMHSVKSISGFFAADHTWDIIEHADFPVMIIPYQARFKPFRLLAFATAMKDADINVLESITSLAQYSNAQILVTNIKSAEKEGNLVKQFFDHVSSKIQYPKIFYHEITGQDIAGSLKQLSARIDIDLLVMVHQRHNFFQELFGGSVTRKMVVHPDKPLLIFPASTIKETVTAF